jgi:hypothetical protein
MIRISPEITSSPFLLTNDQFLAATKIIAEHPELHYDLDEERTKYRGVTRTKLFLWTWPATREGTPTRTWINEDGEVWLTEDVDWIEDEEWPAWV